VLTARERRGWLAARRRGITGTDIAAILGLNPWRNALDVYLDKLGEGDPTPVNEAMWWGTYLEAGMARRYAELHHLRKGELLRGAAIARAFPARRVAVFGSGPGAQVLVRHRVYPFLLATLDGVVPRLERGLELKTASDHAADEWGLQGTDQIPAHYLVQVACYLAVAEMPRWDVAALIGAGARISGNLALYTVWRNRSLENEIVAAADRFWHEHVQKRMPPAIDGSSSWQAHLARTYQKSTGVVLKATLKITELAGRYREAQQRRQKAEIDELYVRNQLAAALRGADKARGAFGTIGWVRPEAKPATDWEALAKFLHPTSAQLARFTKTTQDGAFLRAWWARGHG
jgi:predicted phage-related endonuclease